MPENPAAPAAPAVPAAAPVVVVPAGGAPAAPAAAATPAATTWPETWRNDFAGDNADHMKTLERFQSPRDVFNSYTALRQRLSSGELKSALPANATEDVVKQWRAENGIPETPDKYDLTLKDGIVMGEEDKGWVGDFLKAAHVANFRPEQVKATLEWYHVEKENRIAAAAEKFESAKKTTEDALRADWGADYRRNGALIEGLIDAKGTAQNPELKGLIMRAVQTNPDFAKLMAGMALEINPMPTLAGGGTTTLQGAQARITEINEIMRKDRGRYNRDTAMQEELTRLNGYVVGQKRAAA